ncbi:hypothetical protein H4R34_001267 [Dimargaris verticillata]|uniref:Uncharacterized protein n=1 Tax=Dimargaris verticillata TaxID=2761393 RepID=A0A9W8BAC3_9FUNG|nr:hypothetical protein H4R34_001267 [Dimargaris verticillata]
MAEATIDNAWFYILTMTLDGVSILCALLNMAIVLWIWRKDPKSKQSPSFCLTLWMAIPDILQRVVDLGVSPYTFTEEMTENYSLARFYVWLQWFACYWYVCLNILIAMDLQLVFFHRLPRYAPIRRWYPLIGTVAGFILAFMLLIMPKVRLYYGGAVTIGDRGTAWMPFNAYWTLSWLTLAIVYLVSVMIAILLKLYASQRELRQFDSSNMGMRKMTANPTVLRSARLVMAYPITLAIVYIPYLLNMWFSSFLQGPGVAIWNYITFIIYSSQGIIGLIVLLMHPVVVNLYPGQKFDITSWFSRTQSFLKRPSAPPSMALSNTVGTPGAVSGASQDTAVNSQTSQHPYLKTMDLGPHVTGLFGHPNDSKILVNEDGTVAESNHQTSDYTGSYKNLNTFDSFDDTSCL